MIARVPAGEKLQAQNCKQQGEYLLALLLRARSAGEFSMTVLHRRTVTCARQRRRDDRIKPALVLTAMRISVRRSWARISVEVRRTAVWQHLHL